MSHRTRRRWWWFAAAGAVWCVAVQLWMQPKRAGEGAARWVPTTLVALGAPISLNTQSPTPLMQRRYYDEMWDVQRAIVQLRDIGVTSSDLEGVVRSRSRWPAGSKIEVWSDFPNKFYPRLGTRGLTLSLADSGVILEDTPLDPPWNYVCRLFGLPSEGADPRPVLPDGTHTLQVRVKYTCWLANRSWTLRQCRVPLTVCVGSTAAELLDPVRETGLDQVIRKHLRARISGEPKMLSVWLAYSQEQFDYDGVSRGWTAELLHNGIVESSIVPWLGDWCPSGTADLSKNAVNTLVGENVEPALVYCDPRLADGWTLRVKSFPEFAMKLRDATAYWDGAFEVPLSEVLIPPDAD